MSSRVRSVLFTGYAPVHYLCFRPLHREFERLSEVEVYVSGGLRRATASGFDYDAAPLFDPFGLPPERVLTVDEAAGRRFDVLFSANKRFITPQDNAGASIQIFHGVSFRNMGVRPENLAYDFFFTVGPYMERRFVSSGLLRPNDPRMVQVGFPKTDRLVNGRLDRRALLPRHGLAGNRPILLYAPTGQRKNSLETFGPRVLRRLAELKRYDILVKLHDHPKNGVEAARARLQGIEGNRIRVVEDADIVPLMLMADLLITDASSVSSEFALLDRPMVFLDVPELIGDARASGAQVDLDTWGRRCGITARGPHEAVAAVEQSLREPGRFSAMRRAMAADIFHNPGVATEAAIEWCGRHMLGPSAA